MPRLRSAVALALLFLPAQGVGFAPRPTPVFQFSLSGVPSAIAVDADGSTYVTGPLGYNSQTFPITGDAAQKTQADAFVAKVDPSGTRIVWATYLGGPHSASHSRFSLATNQPTGIAVDAD